MNIRVRIIAASILMAVMAVVVAGALWYVLAPSRSDAGVTVGGMGNGCQCTKRLDR